MSVVKPDNLVQVDSYSEQEYAQNGFVPQSEESAFSYTSGRVAKPVYNKYNKNAFQVFGYYTD
jgi:chitinase